MINKMASQLNKLNGRRQYLVTYSQADEKIFPTRESFGKMLETEFNFGPSAVKVFHWACCKENHSENGVHYHCSLKLTGVKKWVAIRNRIQQQYGICVNFSDKHDFYLSAYRYVCKEDNDIFHSNGHPNLSEAKSPKTKGSIARNKRKSLDKTNKQNNKKSKLSNTDVALFIRNHNIHTYEELLALAESRRVEGLNDICEFVFNRAEKVLRELIEKSWQMATAQANISHSKLDRLQILNHFAYVRDCVCKGEWMKCALEVLQLNQIDRKVFSSAVHNALLKGRGKFQNVLIVGPTNCAKTFILKPLSEIYKGKIFENPANHKFGWSGAESASIIMLQDFRWSKDLISWKDFLLLLEGEIVKLPAPRNIFKEDVCIDTPVAIFGTSKSQITYKGPYNSTDSCEDEMMASRWRIFRFTHQFREAEQKHVSPCANCFANLIVEHN